MEKSNDQVNGRSANFNQEIDDQQLEDDYGGEIDIEAGWQDEEQMRFDTVVGALQEILADEQFDSMQRGFCLKYCMEFEATEENKLSYMQIFKEYQETIEAHLVKSLTEMVPDFNMEEFSSELEKRKE